MTAPRFEPIAASMLASEQSIRFTAEGWSMIPTLRPGDLLVIEPIAHRAVSIGDIIFFLAGERRLVHRVVAISDDGEQFTTRGDGSSRRDSPVSRASILGVLVSARRNDSEIALGSESGSRKFARQMLDVLRRTKAAVPFRR